MGKSPGRGGREERGPEWREPDPLEGELALQKQVLLSLSHNILKFIAFELLSVNVGFVSYAVWYKLHDTPELVLGNGDLFCLSLYSTFSLIFAIRLGIKLIETRQSFEFLFFGLFNTIFFFSEMLILIYYFFVRFNLATTYFQWQNVSLYGVSVSRFITHIEIFVILNSVTVERMNLPKRE